MAFVKGQSGNPLGRPKGSKNLTTSVVKSFSNEEIQLALRKLYDLGMTGRESALKYFLDYFVVKADKQAELEDDKSTSIELSVTQIQDLTKIARDVGLDE